MAKRGLVWRWRTHYERYIANSVPAYEDVALQQRKQVTEWLRKPGNSPYLANALESFATYHAVRGLVEVCEGSTTGWSHIRASLDLIAFSIQIDSALINEGHPGPSLHLGMTVNSLFGAIAFKKHAYAEWCAQHLTSALVSGVYGRHGKDRSYPWQLHCAYPFSLHVAAKYAGITIPHHHIALAPLGDYQPACDALAGQDNKYDEAVLLLCDLHVRDLRKSYNVFGFYPYNMWPAEVLAFQILTAGEKPHLVVEHELMRSPVAIMPDFPTPALEIPFFVEISDYVRGELPKIGAPPKLP